MKKKIKDLFRKVCNKLFRKKTHGIVWGQKFNGSHYKNEPVSTADFRRLFEAAYPDAAKFMEGIKVFPDTNDAFSLQGSFVASGLIAAGGLSLSYREWERECVKQVREQYPDLKILVFRAEQE